MLSGASNIAERVDSVFLGILLICIVLLVLITFLMIFFVIKYRRSKNTNPQDIRGNILLEITWTVIPTILVLGMFYYGWVSYSFMKKVPEGAKSIKVTGQMWSWRFLYENGIQSDTLVVPLGQPIKLDLETQDVLHSFFVPAFRIKQDLVPGLNTYVWFEPLEIGSFDILCAEYCGLQHAYMLATLKVVSEQDFLDWYGKEADGTTINELKGDNNLAAAETKGRELINTKGCIACHSTDGSASVGPSFLGVFGSTVTVVTDGIERRVIADEEYMRKSILKPADDITKGFEPLMPPPVKMDEKEIGEIIDYLKKL